MKKNSYKKPKIIKYSKNNKISSIGSKSQTKNLSKRRRLSGLHNNSNSLKMAYI